MYSQSTPLEEEYVNLTIMDVNTGASYYQSFPITATIREAKSIIIENCMGGDPRMHYKYYLAEAPMYPPLDDSKTIEELGFTQDGKHLYLHTWDCILIHWLNLQTGGSYSEEFPLQATLFNVKIIIIENWLGEDPRMHDKYFISIAPGSEPLDESKTVEQLGIVHGTILYLDKTEPNTPVGTDIKVIDQTSGVSITFSDVIGSGDTLVDISDEGPIPPAGFIVAGAFYEITTTVSFTGNIIIAIPYDDSNVKNENKLKLWYYDLNSGLWEDVTLSVDKHNNIIYGEVSHFSTFAVLEAYIDTTIDIKPSTLNLKSRGKYITVYIELEGCYDVSLIDVSTLLLQETIPVKLKPTRIGDYNSNGIPDLKVKFDRVAVQSSVTVGDSVAITLSGYFYDGTYFMGIGYIRVINPGCKHCHKCFPWKWMLLEILHIL